tara:strand:- start:236 stop:448 length:213 start_codon:yes stop_codon:yes gene_type:complete
MDKLDTENIIEIDRIRKILREHPDLLSMFEIMVIIANNRINEEKSVLKMEIEENIEPDLSSDSEDDILDI